MSSAPKLGNSIVQNDAELWAITSYFNPVGYQRRRDNYRIFRERLSVPLVAVELAYDSEFELRKSDADILIQLRGGAVLWQKERLLNIALQALPKSCRKVAWLDCDIVFGSSAWAEKASALLDTSPIIQLFRHANYLGRQWTPDQNLSAGVEFTRPSAMLTVSEGVPAIKVLGRILDDRRVSSAAGLAWAARRDFLDRHGFYDLCIVGGGDRAMNCAANHCFEGVIETHAMNDKQAARYLRWAETVAKTVRADELTFLDADLYHLWHGDIAKRRGRERHQGFRVFEFDPDADVIEGENGAFLWNTEKPFMHDYVRSFFASREEDG